MGDQDRETESKTKNPQETQELSNSSQIVQGVDPEADSIGAKGKRGAGRTDGSDDRVQAQNNNDVQPTAWKVAGRVDVANMDETAMQYVPSEQDMYLMVAWQSQDRVRQDQMRQGQVTVWKP